MQAALKMLAADRYARVFTLVVALLSVPYLASWETVATQVGYYGTLVLLPILVLAVLDGVGRLPSTAERRFWRFLALALAFWALALVLSLTVPRTSTAVDLLVDAIYGFFYLSFFLALGNRPDAARTRGLVGTYRAFESAGTILTLFVLFLYFILIPVHLDEAGYETWVPSYSLYVALDLLVAARFLWLSFVASARRWRILYGLLGLYCLLNAGLDVAEWVYYYSPSSTWSEGSKVDLLWFLPLFLFLAATRLRHYLDDATTAEVAAAPLPESELKWVESPLVLQAFVFPVIHFGSYSLDLLSEETRPAREALVFLSVLVLGALAVAEQAFQRRRNAVLEEDRRKAEQRFRRLEEQTRENQKMEAVGRLAGGVAHDFNNLLTVILGHASVLERQVPADSPWRHGLAEIHRAAQHAATMTRRLLTFGRKETPRPMDLDLNQVLRDMEPMLRRLIRADIKLVLQLDRGAGLVEADPGQLEQIVLNLAINAGEAMPQGGTLTLTTRGIDLDETGPNWSLDGETGPQVELEVSDTGQGMDRETCLHIFEPFYTTKSGKGTGLGLATVYTIVQQNKGSIQVESTPGRGTTFRVFLPQAIAKASPAPSPQPVAPPARGTETVLVVEDEEPVRRLTVDFLKLQGYRVLEADDGLSGLDLFRRHLGEVQLVLTDVVMPGLNGPGLAAEVRALAPATKVLFMTGYDDGVLARDGGVKVIPKPFSLEVLAGEVRLALDGSGA